MADLPVAGVEVYVQYGWETTFGTEATTIDQPFGHDVRVNITPRNNLIQVRGLGDRNVKALIAGNFEGAVSISFTLATTRWLKAVFGAISSTSGTHTFTQADTIPSMTVEVGYDMGTTDVVRKLLGVKVNSVTIACAVGEVVKVTMDCLYKYEQPIGTTLDSTPATDNLDPVVFTHGGIEFPDGTLISNVQSVELTIANGLIPVYGLGNRSVSALLEGARNYTGRMTHTFENVTAVLNKFGTGGAGTVVNTPMANFHFIDDTGTGLSIMLQDVKLDTDNIAANPNELINEDVTFIALNGSGSGADGLA